jgi:glutamine synthetase
MVSYSDSGFSALSPKDKHLEKYNRVTNYYGENVFNIEAMGHFLGEEDLKVISKVMRVGGKIDSSLANRVAMAVREWALSKGVTHYCHWFQPQTGTTAEKHDAFLWFDGQGKPIEKFTGPDLLQSEPDASSFPSGGMRSTFEARGYTGWDPSSPMFIVQESKGSTLYIPSVFISYYGDALDFKTPLLRSLNSISTQTIKTLGLLGEKDIGHVGVSIGAEQEFFVVDKQYALKRLDLKFAGRTIFGSKAPKGQELEDHYFGSIPSRVQAFINDLERELYKLGVPVKTRHNEVAPGQFEIAPIFEGANIAADHNQLVMKYLKSIALKHNLVVLLHEKPFACVNGSGKHVNWSLVDSKGRNLLDPGATPHSNVLFLTILCGILKGICDHADVLRASISSAGNDHRLGANEAPPAIISVFLGKALNDVLNAIETGSASGKHIHKILLDLGVAQLQNVSQDNTDRNRTSPFAFTGNKFEFRAVGSSASINYPVAVLNAAVTDGLAKVNFLLESRISNGSLSEESLFAVLKQIILETKKIRFEGNGYSQEWREHASQRGLSHLENTPTALEVLRSKEKTQFLIDSKVFSEEDISSRLHIQQERYIKQRMIEVNCALEMVKTQIIPGCVAYEKQLFKAFKLSQELNLTSCSKKIAVEFGEASRRLYGALVNVETCLSKILSVENYDSNLTYVAMEIQGYLLPKLEELRSAVDFVETLLPANLWPYPKYSDLLFGLE